ncbi:MAG: type II toxin-antitoxin system prevent-host-death family antitoxin [Nitrospirae bacterium]|nr:type II toxin-antitoxin system prevent-host-death family antitoxin [Nitrospirota bacterium]
MKKASITETKNRLSALLDRVRHGESVLIMDRDKPVARLEPVSASGDMAFEEWLREMERAGLVRRPGVEPSKLKWSEPIPRPKRGASILAALLAEREESR